MVLVISGACLLHELLADAEQVAEVLPVVDDAVQAVCFQELCDCTKRRLHLLQALLKVLHAHLHERMHRMPVQGTPVWAALVNLSPGGAGALSGGEAPS